MSVAQEIFLVAFSILYGIMLQTYFGLNPFPYGKILKSGKTLTGLTDEQIRNIRKRLFTSLVVLSIVPLIYAVVILRILDLPCFECSSWNLETSLILFFSFWSGLAVFGFQRFYGWIAIKKPKIFWRNHQKIIENLIEEQKEKFYSELKNEEIKEKPQPYDKANLVPVMFYIGLPIATLILSSLCIWLGVIVWILTITVFIGWLWLAR